MASFAPLSGPQAAASLGASLADARPNGRQEQAARYKFAVKAPPSARIMDLDGD